MKKGILIGIILLLVAILVGCNVQIEKESVEEINKVESEDELKEGSQELVESKDESKKDESKLEKSVLPKNFQDLLDKHEKIKSYHYQYNEPPNNQGTNIYYVKEDKIRVDITQSDITLRNKYTSVFLNTKEKTAVGICKLDELRCPDGEVQVDVDYDQYYRKTPIDWMNDVGVGEFTSGQTIDQKITKVYVFEKGGDEYKYYIDEYSGMPMKIVKGSDIWNFKELGANDFQEDYVTP